MRISPTLFYADSMSLGSACQTLKRFGFNSFHVDITDGVFSRQLKMYPKQLRDARRILDRQIVEIHLQVERPLEVLGEIQQPQDIVIIHQESQTQNLLTNITDIRRNNRCMVQVNPSTPLETLTDVIPFIDGVCIVGVTEDRAGRTPMVGTTIERVKKLVQMLPKYNVGPDFIVEVNGGVSWTNIKDVYTQGQNVITAGSKLLFGPDGGFEDSCEKLKQMNR